MFDESLRSSISRWAVDWEGVLGLAGPFWFRPRIERADEVLPGWSKWPATRPHEGMPDAAFAERGLFLIDPDVYMPPTQDRFRYAVIEDGAVRIEDSVLGTIRPGQD